MKRKLIILLFLIIILSSLIFILNIPVSTQRGVNATQSQIEIPLYLKILNFFDRHYNYKDLVKKIVEDRKSDQERMMKIFEWTYKNIKRVPQDLPIIDDHIWYTIVRGYAASDQFSDIFTTLCNYAGIEAFFSNVSSKDGKRKFTFSFARIDGKWAICDPYNGIYFKNKDNRFCEIEALVLSSCRPVDIGGEPRLDIDYSIYFDNILAVARGGLSRANIQSPLRRLLFELKQLKIACIGNNK